MTSARMAQEKSLSLKVIKDTADSIPDRERTLIE